MRRRKRGGASDGDAGADDAKEPRSVERPAGDEELLVVVVRIGLRNMALEHLRSSLCKMDHGATIRLIQTHHNADNDIFNNSNTSQKPRQYLPPKLSPLLPAPNEENVHDHHDEVQRHGEVRQEPGRPPEVTKAGVVGSGGVALLLGREGLTRRIAEVGAALVEPDCLEDVVAFRGSDGVVDPSGEDYGSDGHDRGYRVV